MPIEVNGVKAEPWIGNMKGVKSRVKFKILSPPLRAKTEDGYVDKPLASLSFPATYTMRNAQGGYDVVKYFESKTPLAGSKGELSHRYTPEFIMIDNGEVSVNTKASPDFYWFMNNCPDNATNPLYDLDERGAEAKYAIEGRRTPFLFTEVEKSTKKKKDAELDFDTAVAKCISLITNPDEVSDKAASVLYKAYGFGDADELMELEEFSTIRKALVEQAKIDPSLFMKKMESSATTLEARVNDCLNKGIIVYEQNGDFNGFIWGTTQGEKKGKAKNICSIEAGQYEERVQLFLDFLRTEAKGIKIAEEMKKEIAVFGLGQN